jgi:Spy/CpxP family protein refolding chaperone
MSFGIQGVTSVSSSLSLLSATTNAANGPFSNLNLTTDQQNQIESILSTGKSQGLSFSQINSQINQVLNPAQQQTFQSDLQQVQAHRGGGHHHHHHGGGSSDSGNSMSLLGQLDLSGDQQDQITSLFQSAQANGTSPSALLGQIDNVLSSNQQNTLSSLLSTGTYSSTGNSTTTTLPYLVNTNA